MSFMASALGWVAGIALMQGWPELPSRRLLLSFTAAAVSLLIVRWTLRRPQAPNPASPAMAPGPGELSSGRARCCQLLTVAAAVCAGFAWAGVHAGMRLADSVPTEWERRDIEVIGVIAGLTQRTERGVRFPFQVEQVLTEGAHVPASILLSWYGERPTRLQPVQAAERWRLVIRVRRPHGSVNPNGFDLEAWLLERNLRATGYVRQGVARLDARVDRPGPLIERARERIRARFERTLGPAEYLGVLGALAIGDQQAIPAAQWEAFTRTGINHLMSISGLHVTMIAALAFWLAKAGWRRAGRLAERLPARKAAAAVGLAVAFGYALLAGFSVPTRRTVFMLAVITIALWQDRRTGSLRVLAGALLAVTTLDPWAVLAPGFWLSFGAVAVMMSVSAGRIARQDPAGETRQAGERLRAGGQAMLGMVRQWWQVQWAITLGMVPVTLALFAQVSLVSPLANAFAIPVISMVVVPVALASVLLPLPALLHVAHAVTAACLGPIEYLSSLSWAVWLQPTPAAWASALALAGVVWWLMPPGWPARWLGLVCLLPMLLAKPSEIAHGTLEMTLLDVGHGLAVVARTSGHALLYDTGPAWTRESDAGGRIVVPYLRAQGLYRLDALIVSHDDVDHAGGAVSVLRALRVESLLSSLPPGHPAFAFAQQPLLCHAGQHWTWDGVQFRILHPDWESHAEPAPDNERSCVLQIEASGRRVLLTGDIGVASEARLLARAQQAGDPAALATDVLLVPHHGSGGSSGPAFVAAVRPRLALMSIGYRNRFGHPRPDVVERYRNADTAVLRTDETGAVRVTIDGSGITVRRERAHARRYWRAPPP